MRIANNCVVSLNYRLTNAAGQLLDSSPQGEPLEYLHGSEGLLPLLESALAGKAAGDAFDVTITPEEGFGERQPRLVEVLSRETVGGAEQVQVGMQVNKEAEDGGMPRMYTVTAVNEATITIDGNHPLAGETLRFQGTVVAVRAATAEELAEHVTATAALR